MLIFENTSWKEVEDVIATKNQTIKIKGTGFHNSFLYIGSLGLENNIFDNIFPINEDKKK